MVGQNHFDRMYWYEANPNYSDDLLTEIDRKNVKLILSVEHSLGGPLSDAEHVGLTEEEEFMWMNGA